MKYAQVQKGKKAENPVTIQVAGEAVAAMTTPLTALEEIEVVAQATRLAKEKGTEPKDGHPVYDAAMYAHTLYLATLDKDSPPHAREKFFPSAEAILGDYGSDELARMHEEQQLWQEECSPLVRAKTFDELVGMTKRLASDQGEFFFLALSPRTRLLWALTTARLFASSPELNALSSSASPGTGPSS